MIVFDDQQDGQRIVATTLCIQAALKRIERLRSLGRHRRISIIVSRCVVVRVVSVSSCTGRGNRIRGNNDVSDNFVIIWKLARFLYFVDGSVLVKRNALW
jgi:hypothetical protein